MKSTPPSASWTHRAPRAALAPGLLFLLLVGCVEHPEAEVLPEPPSPLCEGLPARTLDEVYAQHFSADRPTGCTAGCHELGLGNLSFRDARELWQATVLQPSAVEKARFLVEPGHPERSHLYLKLLPEAVSRMPAREPFLDEAALRDVAGWICAGAPAPAN